MHSQELLIGLSVIRHPHAQTSFPAATFPQLPIPPGKMPLARGYPRPLGQQLSSLTHRSMKLNSPYRPCRATPLSLCNGPKELRHQKSDGYNQSLSDSSVVKRTRMLSVSNHRAPPEEELVTSSSQSGCNADYWGAEIHASLPIALHVNLSVSILPSETLSQLSETGPGISSCADRGANCFHSAQASGGRECMCGEWVQEAGGVGRPKGQDRSRSIY